MKKYMAVKNYKKAVKNYKKAVKKPSILPNKKALKY